MPSRMERKQDAYIGGEDDIKSTLAELRWQWMRPVEGSHIDRVHSPVESDDSAQAR